MSDPVAAELDGRILEATVMVIAEHGYAGASVARIARRAQVATRTFHREFEGVEDCLLAVMDATLDRLGELAADAFAREDSWQDGLRVALAWALRFFDENPELTRVCFVETLAAGKATIERREYNVGAYRSLVAELAQLESPDFSPLAIEGVMASVMGIIYARLIDPEPTPLISLLAPLTGWMLAPFLAHHETQAQVRQAAEDAQKLLAERARKFRAIAREAPEVPLPAFLRDAKAHRARQCVLYLQEHPGASNRAVARNIGIAHQAQVSRLLTRLAALGVITTCSGRAGYVNASTLTHEGEQMACILRNQERDRVRYSTRLRRSARDNEHESPAVFTNVPLRKS